MKYAKLIGLSAALTLAACASQTPRPDDDSLLPVMVEVPDELPGFLLAHRKPDPDPRHGTQFRYSSHTHPELVSDVFVYLGGIFPDHDTAAEGLRAEMTLSLEQAAEHGLMTDVEVMDDARYKVGTRYGDNSGIHLRFAMKRDGEEFISHAHLFYLPPYTIKFRSSFPGSGNRSFDEELHRLAQRFMAEVEIGEEIRCRSSITIHGLREGSKPWVSMDGLDVMLPVDELSETMVPLLLLSSARMKNNFCVERNAPPQIHED